jgi:hypothetical protein
MFANFLDQYYVRTKTKLNDTGFSLIGFEVGLTTNTGLVGRPYGYHAILVIRINFYILYMSQAYWEFGITGMPWNYG